MLIRKPTLMERFLEYYQGATLIGFITKPGWKGELPYYRFKCMKHGEVENHVQGFSDELRCPRCQQENTLHESA